MNTFDAIVAGLDMGTPCRSCGSTSLDLSFDIPMCLPCTKAAEDAAVQVERIIVAVERLTALAPALPSSVKVAVLADLGFIELAVSKLVLEVWS